MNETIMLNAIAWEEYWSPSLMGDGNNRLRLEENSRLASRFGEHLGLTMVAAWGRHAMATPAARLLA